MCEDERVEDVLGERRAVIAMGQRASEAVIATLFHSEIPYFYFLFSPGQRH